MLVEKNITHFVWTEGGFSQPEILSRLDRTRVSKTENMHFSLEPGVISHRTKPATLARLDQGAFVVHIFVGKGVEGLGVWRAGWGLNVSNQNLSPGPVGHACQFVLLVRQTLRYIL